MKYLVMTILLFVGCAPPAPTSLLIGEQQVIGGPQSAQAVLSFDVGGTFTINQTYPFICNQGGTWVDNTPGQIAGSVLMTYTIDTCLQPPLTGTSDTYSYVVVQGNLVVNLAL